MILANKEPLLVRIGRERFEHPSENSVHLVDDPEANAFLNDLEHFPHAYVLACCMDRQTKAEQAWMIPIKIRDIIGDFSMDRLAAVSEKEYQQYFADNSLHRFNDTMGSVFYKTVQRIQCEYAGDASQIWSCNPSSASVVYRFLQFDGVGIKIATMATNILARQFRIPFSDYYSIDVSPDIHVRRVMQRYGLIYSNATNDSIIYKARELCPDFPGIIDFSLWEIGRKWCRPNAPDCKNCILADECPKRVTPCESE